MSALASWWRLRSIREQRLLLVMLAALGAFAAWLVVVRPLNEALADARERHSASVIELAAARAKADEVRSLGGLPRGSAPLPLGAFLNRSATDAGFPVGGTADQGEGAATISLASVRSQAFFSWVAQMERTHGLVVDRLAATANGDQTLSAEVGFRMRGR